MSAPDRGRTPFVAVTATFLVLSLALLGLMAAYRVRVLEPRLRNEAVAQAEVLARSQAGFIASALRSGSAEARVRTVSEALDELLLLRDATSETPYFASVALEVDYDVVDAPAGSLDLHRGDERDAGFPASVPVFDPASSELMALAKFRVDDHFYERLRRDVRQELLWVSAAVQGLLLLLWGGLLALLARQQRDREQRVKVEAELSLQESRYDRLVNSLSNYFPYGRDARGRVTFVGDSVRRVLGFTPEEFLALPIGNLTIPVDGGTLTSAGERCFPVEVPDASDDVHHLELAELPVWSDDRRKLLGWEGLARDVTPHRVFQMELEHARDRAEAASRAKSQFLANVSHEIRTPLNAILGMAGLALRGQPDGRLTQQLQRIRASAQMLAEIVDDILDLSRVEAGRLEIQREDFDLDEILADVAQVVGQRAGDKGLEVTFAPEPAVPRHLRGDPVRLKQVLLNLLNNAIKFTEQGEVVVSIATADARRGKSVLRFAVRDTGIGIAPEHLQGLFEPFMQVDASSTRRYGGAGLGLALSRRLVRLMGGELVAESAPGEGSTFTFDCEFERAGATAPGRALSAELRGIRVLLADDHESARLALASMLEALSCKVTAVASGEEAVAAMQDAIARGDAYRLVLLDWKMPGLDGLEAARRLTALAPDHPPSMILVTAYDRDDAVRRAAEGLVSDVLPKPVSPSTLHDAIQGALAPERPRRSGEHVLPRFAGGQRVLLVEDNAINREVARELLQHAGLDVVEAHNGAEALEALRGARFDVVLMDVQMPVMDGLDAVRAIRARPEVAHLPVVALTAHAMLGDRERFLDAGMSAYVSKPIDEAELLAVIGRWLRSAEQALQDASHKAATRDALPTELPGLDVTGGLRRTSGNAALFRRLLASFARDLDGSVERLAGHLQGGDASSALHVLHTLKGTSATVGATTIAKLAAGIEATLRHDATARPDLGPLAAACREAADSIAQVAPAVAADPGPEDPLDAELARRALPLVHELETHLASSNLAATTTFGALKTMLGGRLRGPLADAESCLDRLDFDAAAPHVAAISTALADATR